MSADDHGADTTPIFPVAVMNEACIFYRGLGFRVESFDDGYAWVRYAGTEILHLRLVPDLDPATNRSAAYFHVGDADRWHSEWSAAAVAVGDIVDTPWGMREFLLIDPAGNLLRVGHAIGRR
jgi:catechol 2,3-dioxygenase-like lactoylglutathione lyase family enzyme